MTSNLQILVIEDDPNGAEMVEMMLLSAGLKTTAVGSAEAALAQLNAAPNAFSAGIVDLALPEMDGFELMQELKRNPTFAHLPLIAMTAYHTPELKVKALETGFDAYLAKPLDTMLFLQTLERLIAS